MKTIKQLATLILILTLSSSFKLQKQESISLTVQVSDLRNANGYVQFALYNKENSIPDKNYEKYFKKQKAEIIDKSSSVTFENLPAGKYAVGVFHDENKNGKIDKGFIKPLEGIGYSNYESIGLSNKPKYSKANFELVENKTINIKVIYLSK